MMMPEQRIAEIRELLDAASKGPWKNNSYNKIYTEHDYGYMHATLHDESGDWYDNTQLPIERRIELYDADPTVCHVPAMHGDTASRRHRADLDLLCKVPEIIAYLLARLAKADLVVEDAKQLSVHDLPISAFKRRATDCRASIADYEAEVHTESSKVSIQSVGEPE